MEVSVLARWGTRPQRPESWVDRSQVVGVDQMPGFRSCFLTDLKGRFLVVCMCVLSGVSVFATSCTVAWQAPLPVELFRQEYWRAMPFPPVGDLPNPGIEPVSLASPALASGLFITSTTWEARALGRINQRSERQGGD